MSLYTNPDDRYKNIKKEGSYKTSAAKITIGTISGYDLKDKKSVGISEFMETLANIQLKISGIYIPFVITKGFVCYTVDGKNVAEPIYILTARRNPYYDKDDSIWRNAVNTVAKELKDAYKQETVSVEFSSIDYYVFK